MKKIFILMLGIVLLIGFASAGIIDNVVKEEDINNIYGYPKLDIKNVFGLGNVVWSGQIYEHTTSCGNNCLSVINLTNFNKGSLVQDIKFFKNENGEWIERDLRSWEIQYNDGSGWNTYKLNDDLEAGNYLIKIIGEKDPTWEVDWIIKSRGRWLNEWAVWGGVNFVGSEYQLIVLADNVTGATGSIVVTEVNTGIYKINSTNPDDEISRALVSQWLFYGTDGTNPRATSTYITNPTKVYTNMARDDNKRGHYGYIQGSSQTGQYLGTFQDTTTNQDCSYWGYANGATPSSNLGTDTSAQELDNPANVRVRGETNTDGFVYFPSATLKLQSGGSATVTGGRVILLCRGNITWVKSGAGTVIDTDFLYDEGFPIMEYTDSGFTLNSPGDYSSSEELEFNCTAEVGGGATLVNMTLYTNETGSWGLRNSTTGLSTSSYTETWNRTINDENNIIWGCGACDSDGDCGFSYNKSLIIDATPPIINIVSPKGTLTNIQIGDSVELNYTIVDDNPGSCWFDYNGTNISIASCITNTTFSQEEDNFNLTFYANDTLGNLNSTTTTWNFSFLTINQTFNNVTTEGNTETFKLWLQTNQQISTVNLIYDGVSNSGTFSGGTGFLYELDTTKTIPEVSADENKSFYWSITLEDSSIFNTSSYNQTVLNLGIDNCSVHSNVLFNLTMVDEESQNILDNSTLNRTIEVAVNIYPELDYGGNTLLVFNKSFLDTNPASVCISDIENSSYYMDSVIKYYADAYSVEYYNILKSELNSSSINRNITLYNLKFIDSTDFQLTFRNENLILEENILVYVNRQYVSENNFKTVEIPKTDSNGQAILHLRRNDIVYNFIMVNENGTVLATFNNVVAFCQDFTTGQCTINLNARSSDDIAYNYNQDVGISYSINYNSTNSLASFTFTTLDSSTKNVEFVIVRNNDFGNRSVCNNSLFSSSGTINCDLESVRDTDNYVFLYVYIDGVLQIQSTLKLDSELGFGIDGVFLAFLFIIVIVSLFIDDKKSVLIALLIGWVTVIALGLVKGSLFGVTTGGIWLLISIILFFWKIKKDESP